MVAKLAGYHHELAVVLFKFAPQSLWDAAGSLADCIQPRRLGLPPLASATHVRGRRLVPRRGLDGPLDPLRNCCESS